MPLVGNDPPTPEDFRKAGFTADAINYPRTDAELRRLCAFNGVDLDKHPIPRAWAYFPDEGMRAFGERNLAKHGGLEAAIAYSRRPAV